MDERTDIDQPYEGQKFASFEALKKYLEDYGRRNYVKFWIRSSHTRNSLKAKNSKAVNPDFKYVSVKFACIFGGEKIRCRGSGIRKSYTYRNLGCPCVINAVVGEDGNHVKLDNVILEHNHMLCKTLYDSIKKTKKRNLTLTNNIQSNNNNGTEVSQKIQLIDELSFPSTSVKDLQFIKQKLDNRILVNDCEEEDLSALNGDSDSTEKCIKDIKDKYGNNVKILVVGSNDDLVNDVLKSTDKGENSESNQKDDDNQLPNMYSDICRLCLSSDDKLLPIFNPDLPVQSTVLSFKIMGCASIEISSDDGLPNNICKTCEETLDIAYNFRLRCENADTILRRACLRNDFLKLTKNLCAQKKLEKVSDDKGSNEKVSTLENAISYQEIAVDKENSSTEAQVEKEITSKSFETPIQDSFSVEFPATCPVCESNFGTYESMLDHLENHPDDETILLACNICSLICPSIKELQDHMRDHAKDAKVNVFSCENCEMTFSTSEEFKVHQDSHIAEPPTSTPETQGKKSSEINFLCNVCGKILKSKDRFLSHRNTHEGLRPHICLKCGKGFADRKNMHQHYDVVHLRKAKHECPVCQKKFYTRTKMKSHITMHYGVKPFSCEICNKSFRLKMNMIKHKKTHSNDRPHQCDKCNAAFIDKNMLKRHSYIHGGLRPYPCPVCGHRFSVKFHLKKHLEKSKCSGGVTIVDPHNYDWTTIAQADSGLTENECVVVYKANEENVLGGEGITMDILEEYNEVPNS